MKFKNTLYIMMVLFVLCACTEQDIETYGDTNYIYFEEEGEEGYPTGYFTFIFGDEDVEQHVFEIPLNVTGAFTGNNRAFSVSVSDSSTAVEGVHYVILDEENVIADQATGGHLSIQLNRTEDLLDDEVSLILTLTEDENFRPAENKTFVLRFSDFFAEPDWWMYPWGNGFFPTIGPFSQVKAGYWLEFYGIEDGSNPWCCSPYWDGESMFGVGRLDNPYPSLSWNLAVDDIGRFTFWLNQLEEQNGAPLLDENGDRILDTMEYDYVLN